MNQSGFSKGLYLIAEWIMRFSVINILWIIFNLPIFYFVFNPYFINDLNNFWLLVIFIIPLLPIVFFPATMAMFAMVRDWVMKPNEDVDLVQSYWRYYKENYLNSLISGVIITILWGVWALDIYFLTEWNQFFKVVFLILGIILFVYTVNILSVFVHYQINALAGLKRAFFITMISPVLFIAIVISSGLVFYISLLVSHFFFIFLSGTLLSFLCFSAFYRNYLKMIEK